MVKLPGRNSNHCAKPVAPCQALLQVAVLNTAKLRMAADEFTAGLAALRASRGELAVPASVAGALLQQVLQSTGASAPVLAPHNSNSWVHQLGKLAANADTIDTEFQVLLMMGSCCRYNRLAPKGRRLETFSCPVTVGGSRASNMAQVCGTPGHQVTCNVGAVVLEVA